MVCLLSILRTPFHIYIVTAFVVRSQDRRSLDQNGRLSRTDAVSVLMLYYNTISLVNAYLLVDCPALAYYVTSLWPLGHFLQ